MDIELLLDVANNVWEALRSSETQEDIDQILDLTESVRDKVRKAFHIASDAADDVANVAIIVMEAAARISSASAPGSRAIPVKPIRAMSSRKDVVDLVIAEYLADSGDIE